MFAEFANISTKSRVSDKTSKVMTTTLRVCVLQSNPLIGDVLHNLSRLRRAIERDPSRADLYVAPELALVGYSPRDLLSLPRLLRSESEALQEIAALSQQHGIGILIGHTESRSGPGKPLHNAATLFDSGLCAGRVRKRRLPHYDVFEEDRFFESYEANDQRPLMFRGTRIGIFICEDAWNEVQRFGKNDFASLPHEDLLRRQLEGSELIINISASPYTFGKTQRRLDTFSRHAKAHTAPLIFAGSVGAQDHVLFDGGSFALNPEGRCVAEAERFVEAELLLEVERSTRTVRNLGGAAETPIVSEWEKLRRALTMGIADYVTKSGFQKVIIGLSGGIDSALVAALACDALGAANVLGVSLPSRFNSNETRDDARTLAKNLGMEFREIPIEDPVRAVRDALALSESGLAYENLQSRCRGVTLMTLSALESRLLLATGNKSEFAMGYATLYGDMCGALAPIGDLYKTEVFGLCHWMQSRKAIFPPSLLLRAPSAELAPNQKDQDSLPDYAVLDTLLEDMIDNQGIHREVLRPFMDACSEHSLENL